MNWMKSTSTSLVLVAVLGCSNPADNVTPAAVGEAKETSAATAAAPIGAKSYVIDADSKIEFTGSKVTGSHVGGFRVFEGRLAVADGQLAPAGQTIQIDMDSAWSDNERLTGHLKSADFFAVGEFPMTTFDITAVEPAGANFTVTGNLTLHGITKSISFPADVQITDEDVRLQAEFFIKRFDFDIKYPGRADDLIRDEVVIRLDITANAS